MIGQAGVDLVERMRRSERERRKQWLKPGVRDDFVQQMTLARAAARGTKDPEKLGPDKFAASKASIEEDKDVKTFFFAKSSIDMAKEALIPIVVRRTRNSTQPGGQPVLCIDPYMESTAWIKLMLDEYEAVNAVAQLSQDEKR
jgi:hypothetical protein